MKIKIDYREIIGEPLPAHETAVDGLYLDSEHKIQINHTLCPEEQAAILLHELIHAIWTIRGFPARMAEEEVCTALAPALATVIHDNPLMMRSIILALTEHMPIFDEGEKT